MTGSVTKFTYAIFTFYLVIFARYRDVHDRVTYEYRLRSQIRLLKLFTKTFPVKALCYSVHNYFAEIYTSFEVYQSL